MDFEITIDTTPEEIREILDRALCESFTQQDELDSVCENLSAINQELTLAQAELTALDDADPGIDRTAIQEHVNKKMQSSMIVSALLEKQNLARERKAELETAKRLTKMSLLDTMRGRSFELQYQQRFKQTAEIQQLEREIRELESNHIGVKAAYEVTANIGRFSRQWLN